MININLYINKILNIIEKVGNQLIISNPTIDYVNLLEQIVMETSEYYNIIINKMDSNIQNESVIV